MENILVMNEDRWLLLNKERGMLSCVTLMDIVYVKLNNGTYNIIKNRLTSDFGIVSRSKLIEVLYNANYI